MRLAAIAIVTAVLIAGCGKSEKKSTTTASAKPARTAEVPPPHPANPRYTPSAHHKHRPPGFIYNDEIGEDVLTAPYDRVIEVFGPPASRHGHCIRYKIVGRPTDMWQFCFRGQRMISAGGPN